MKARTVFLSGRSMLLSLVANSLMECPDVRVIYGQTWAEVEGLASGSTPDVLIYDLNDTPEREALTLLHHNPRLQLIGLDAESNRAVLIAGKETRSLTLERVREIVG